MTREITQQLRDLLKNVVSPHVCDNGCRCDDLKAAIVLLDAELSRPEEREWRVVWNKESGKIDASGPVSERWKAESTVASLSTCQRHYANLRIECRTPAGPWEPKL